MKKNLRIVSAAAAALLAVAPVAATGLTQAVSAATEQQLPATVPAQVNVGDYFTFVKTDQQPNPSVTAYVHGDPENNTVSQPYTLSLNDVGGYENQLKVISNKRVVRSENNNEVQYVQVQYVQKDNGANVKAWIPVGQTSILTYHANGGEQEASNVYLRVGDGDTLAGEGAYADNNTVYAGDTASAGVTSLATLKDAVEKLVQLGSDTGANHSFVKLGKDDWNKYVWNNGSATNDANLIAQLSKQGVWKNNKIDAGSKAFHVDVTTNGGNTVRVVFQHTSYSDSDAPVIIYKNNGEGTVLGTVANGYSNAGNWTPVNGHVLTIMKHDSGTFQPTDYFGAWESNTKRGRINVTVKSSNVDWTKNGLYSVELSATNQAGKTTTATVPVIVTDVKGQVKTVVNNTDVYTEQNGSMTKANLVNFAQTVTPGSQVYVYGSAVTKKLDGKDVQFYRIVSPSANFWVKASDLKDGQTTTNNDANKGVAQTGTVKIMHAAYTYEIKDGKLGSRVTSADTLHAYSEVPVYGTVTVNGKKYYRVSATQDWYINAGNVDGTQRTLKHNSYVYNNKGKRVKSEGTWKKNSRHTTYGAAMTVKGNRMYRVAENRYVKVVNFN
ncbi:SLAP domain-containing protein [uncultured Lactobacillus sp.]|uniref:SLAP domain-containing protein n=1 Tax=uncultured Lactobacillus sp. TaxID=153152 RepID=UPI002805E1EE|nr:SLAP domain-containing protein [uncultured Lactobacillus sp.]